jgi:dTDP-4-dehydrorhamnose reductase
MIWVLGNKGMLGRELTALLEKEGGEKIIPEYIGTDREVDITNGDALSGFVKDKEIGWIVNCAAYTAVDKAEDDADSCRHLNVDGVVDIAKLAERIGAKLIHISTDYVFDGKGERPYREEDETNPIGVYGMTKRDGEVEVLKNCKKSYIIRTSWLYGKYGNNFVYTMLRLMSERDCLRVVNDQRGSPTWANDLAGVIIDLIRAVNGGKEIPSGIYHYTNEGDITWYNFAEAIYGEGQSLGIITKNCAVMPCMTAEYPTKAERPAYSVLDKTKIKTALAVDIPDWKASLRKFLINCNK